MAYLDGNVTDQNEVPVEGALVYVYSGGSLADLEDSLGQPIQNPVTTGEDGYWQAYVADGYYTARYFWGGRQRYVEANVLAGAPPVGPNSDPNVRFDLASTDIGKGASLVAWIREATGAVTRTVADLFDDRPSVMDFIPLVERVKIRLQTSTADLSPYFQSAVDFASGRKCRLRVPAGLYHLGCPNTAVNASSANDYQGYQSWEDPQFGDSLVYAVEMKSNVELEVEAGATIKAADDISTDASPQNWVLFFSLDHLEHVRFTGHGTIDGNAANNKMSPNRANTALTQEQRYNRMHQAAIMWEGPFGKVDHFLVDGLTFQNFNGANVIVTGRVATPVLGQWQRVNATFLECGLDTYDCSVVNMMCDNGTLTGHFENASEYAPTATDLSGLSACYETHGSNFYVNITSKNTNRTGFISYALNFRDWASVNGTLYAGYVWGHAAKNVTVEGGSYLNVKFTGVDIGFAPIPGVTDVPENIVFRKNFIEMSASDTNVDPGDKPAAVQVLGSGNIIGPIKRLRIEDNEAVRAPSASGRSSVFLNLSLQADGSEDNRIAGNTATGFTIGENIVTDGDMAAGVLTSEGNSYLNPEGGTVPASSRVGTFILAQGGELSALYWQNTVIDTRATNGWDKGIAISTSAPTTIRRVHIGRASRFDYRFDVADMIDGFLHADLTIDRLLGVAVTGSFPDTSYGTLTGAAVAATTLPGASPADELVVGYDSEVTNAGGFLLMPFYSGTDEVSLAIRNVTSGTLFTTPGFTFRITAYPGR